MEGKRERGGGWMKGGKPTVTVWRKMKPSLVWLKLQVGMRKENTNRRADWNFPRQNGIKAKGKD